MGDWEISRLVNWEISRLTSLVGGFFMPRMHGFSGLDFEVYGKMGLVPDGTRGRVWVRFLPIFGTCRHHGSCGVVLG